MACTTVRGIYTELGVLMMIVETCSTSDSITSISHSRASPVVEVKAEGLTLCADLPLHPFDHQLFWETHP